MKRIAVALSAALLVFSFAAVSFAADAPADSGAAPAKMMKHKASKKHKGHKKAVKKAMADSTAAK